ncbi:MAG: PEP-CTERM sorting domain-containing protein [Phycisphaeraceae bacterium]
MKLTTLAALTAISALAVSTTASAALSTVSAFPGDDVLLLQGDGAGLGGGSSQATFGFRNADATDRVRGRGQSFVIDADGGAAYNISSLTVSLANSVGNGTRPEGNLDLYIFTWDSDIEDNTSWLNGDGFVDGDLLDGTGLTQVYTESFDVAANSTFLSTEFLQLTFDEGDVVLGEDVNYGFFFQYRLDDTTGLTSDFTIAFDADNNTDIAAQSGTLLNTDDVANGVSATRVLNYAITGTVVPEPSSLALLGLGGLLIARRRRG